MLTFAVHGTVIGVAYILTYNVPPLEITGTAMILVACFVFRNLPVGVRSGVAAMSQLDKSLDEAAITLRAVHLPRADHGGAALAEARHRHRAGLFLRARDDDRLRRDLPRLGGIRDGDGLHHQPRDQRRLRARPIAYCAVLIVLMMTAIGPDHPGSSAVAHVWGAGRGRPGLYSAGGPRVTYPTPGPARRKSVRALASALGR
jgi:hypothetical protein